MRIWHHKINELDPDRQGRERKQGVIYYVRRFWHIYGKPKTVVKDGYELEHDTELFSGHLEIRIKPGFDFACMLDIGNSGSETPWDGHVAIFGAQFYWGFSRGRRLAQWLTHKRNEAPNSRGYSPGQYRNRSIGFSTFEGNLRTAVWVDKHGDYDSREKQPAKWRQGFYSTDIRDHLFGSLRYRYIDLAEHETVIEIEELNSINGIKTAYPVELTLQRVERYRTKQPNKVLEQDYSLHIDAPRGIPTHYDKSGGWKGDSTYGWSVKFPHGNVKTDRWKQQAEQLVLGDIYRMRGRTGFTIPQMED